MIVKKRDVVVFSKQTATAPVDAESPDYSFGCVQYLKKEGNQHVAHVALMYESAKTMVGKCGNPRELFFSNECADMVVSKTTKVVKTKFQHSQKYNENKGSFFATKTYTYSNARYETLPAYFPDVENSLSCGNCSLSNKEIEQSKFEVKNDGKGRIKCLIHKNCKYLLRDCVLIEPTVVDFTYKREKPDLNQPLDKDKFFLEKSGGGLLYPEYYRKKENEIINQPSNLEDPFKIGRILKFRKVKENKYEIYVELFYRVIDTNIGEEEISEHDIHKIYLSGQRVWVDVEDVVNKCQIKFLKEDEKPDDFNDIEQRKIVSFYFKEFFDEKNQKVKKLSKVHLDVEAENKEVYKKRKLIKVALSDRKLKTMELFAGCGGLSLGLIQSGVADLKWAAEYEEAPVDSLRANHKDTCKVFHVDCNKMLKDMREADRTGRENSEGYPKKGDVELLCGGPPCQGFSGMNRHHKGTHSLNKNRMFVNFLSFADFLKPKYVICENVRAFVSNDKNNTIKKTIATFLAMGYQCCFAVLQAGHYGPPQVRRRIIIIASAPKEILPYYPEPLHVFTGSGLDVKVDDITYVNNIRHQNSAPFGCTTIRKAIEDLPLKTVKYGSKHHIDYLDSKPLSTYQKLMRRNSSELTQHASKKLSPLILARIQLIPKMPGADWRDLPNKIVKLTEGQGYTQYLYYDYIYTDSKKEGNPYLERKYKKKNLHQGVCKCCVKKERRKEKQCRLSAQDKTLIPWCLPHTSDTHNNWKGLYGRISYDGFMQTCVTSPCPMGKQGSVLHPIADRLVSCREFARMQGFPDYYKLLGENVNKIFKQIGNAVPPPMAKAVGVEIRIAMAQKELELKKHTTFR